nr:pseudouridine-5'-phosphatase-like [Bactrocera oleae]
MCSKFKKVTHCIFDMDGLLLDTVVVYEEIVRQIAGSFNKSYSRDVRVKMY